MAASPLPFMASTSGTADVSVRAVGAMLVLADGFSEAEEGDVDLLS